MWIESPRTGELINFDEVYRIRCYEYVSNDAKHLRIDIYFFLKHVAGSDGFYRTTQNEQEFFNGELAVGLQFKEWLKEKLGVHIFEAVDPAPIEVVVDENLMKKVVDGCLSHVKNIESLLPEDQYLNPFLQDILSDQDTVDYLIERRKAIFTAKQHKNWELDYALTVEIEKTLSILCKSMETLGFAPKLTKYQKETLREIIGDGSEVEE